MSSKAKPIEILLGRLKAAALKVDYRDVRDALWLSRFLPSPNIEAADHVPIQLPEPESPPSDHGKMQGSNSEARPYGKHAVSKPQTEDMPLYTSAKSQTDSSSVPASTVRAPGVTALPRSLEIAGALRPFLKRFASRQSFVFDEEATVQRIAEGSSLVPNSTRPLFMEPLFCPRKERWFDVVLIVEDTPAVIIWKETINTLARLLSTHGAFSDVRRWGMRMADEQLDILGPSGEKRSGKELKHPTARRLIVVISDCISKGWNNGAISEVMLEWGSTTPVVILQVLPERLWMHTALGPANIRIRSTLPGLPNSQLKIEKEWWDTDPVDPRRVFPVITLEPSSIKEWAEMIMGGDARSPAILMPLDAEWDNLPVDAPAEFTPESRIQRFRSIVSPEAFQLAAYCTLVPLTLPVMRLVQATMLPGSKQAHLAEVLLGGLIKRVTPAGTRAQEDHILYDYHEGVRDVLSKSMRDSEFIKVLLTVSKYIERHTGQAFDFEALTADPEGLSRLPEGAIPFAKVSTGFLKRMRSLGLSKDESIVSQPSAISEQVEEEVFAPGLTIRKSYESPQPIKDLAYSPDGSMLALLHNRGVTILSTETGEVVYTFIPRFALANKPSSTLATIDPSSTVPSIIFFHDEHSRDFASALASQLDHEIEKRIGRRINIISGLGVTDRGPSEISQMNSPGCIAVVLMTPDYFRRKSTYQEARVFIDTQKAHGIKPKIIPIQLIDFERSLVELSEVSEYFAEPLWLDWREFRGMPPESPALKQIIAKFADSLVWRFFEDAESETISQMLNAGMAPLWCDAMAWSTDSTTLAVALKSHLTGVIPIAELDIKTWEAKLHELIQMPGRVGKLRWQPNRSQVAMTLSGGFVCLWNSKEPIEWQLLPSYTGPQQGEPADIEWSPDGRNLAVFDSVGFLRLFGEDSPGPTLISLSKDTAPPTLRHIAFIPNSNLMAVARSTEGITIWDYAQQKIVRTVETGGLGVHSLSVSSDGNLIAATLETRLLRVWQAETGEVVPLDKDTYNVRSISLVEFSPRGSELTVLDDRFVHVLRIDNSVFQQHVQLNDYAIIIGIDYYPSLDNIRVAKPNAAAFLDWVCSPTGGGVSRDRCQVLLSPSYSRPPEIDGEPTEQQVVRAFAELLDLSYALEPGGRLGRRLFLYMSGLGVRTSDGEIALLTADASTHSLGYNVPGRLYANLFRDSGAFEEVILFMDCFTLLSIEAPPVIPFVKRQQLSKKVRYLYGFSSNSFVPRQPMESGGIFSQALLKGLHGEAAEIDGKVTARSLINFTQSAYSLQQTWATRPIFEFNDIDLVIAAPSSGLGKVQIHFDPLYVGMEALIVDSRFNSVSTTIAGIEAWEIELTFGFYEIRIPSVSLSRSFSIVGDVVTNVSVEWQFKEQWILVAGTGNDDLSDAEYSMCKVLGRKLAEAGYGLITGVWEGVDYWVGHSFMDRMRSVELSPKQYYRQIVPRWRTPKVVGGTIISVTNEEAEFTEAVRRASAVVLIGGSGSTYLVYRYAKIVALPVIPIPGTEGDARVVYNEVLELNKEAGVTHLFRPLDVPINTIEDAELVAELVVNALVGLVKKKIDTRESEGAFEDKQFSPLQLEDVLSAYQHNYELKVNRQDRGGQASTLYSLGKLLQRLGRVNEAIEMLRQGQVIAEHLDDKALHARMLDRLGLVLQQEGRYKEAIDAFQRSRAIFEQLGDSRSLVMVLNSLGRVLQGQGKFHEAEEAYRRSLQIGEAIDDKEHMAMALNNFGGLLQRMGRFDEALNVLRRSRAILIELGDIHSHAMVLKSMGSVLQRLGRFDEAIDMFQRSRAIFEQLGDSRSLAMVLNSLGTVLQRAGKFDEAVDVLDKSLLISTELQDQRTLAIAHFVRGNALLGRGDIEGSVSEFISTFEINESLKDKRGLDIVLSRLIPILVNRNSNKEATELLNRALKIDPKSAKFRRLQKTIPTV